MTNDVKEAMERLRNDDYDVARDSDFYDEHNCTRYEADCEILARAYLAENDDTPITWDEAESVLADSIYGLVQRNGQMLITDAHIPINTRGEFRKAMELLGIPLKPANWPD